MKKIMLILCLSLLVAMGPSLPGSSADGVSPVDSDNIINSKAPEFSLKDVNGKSVSLASYKGKVVLLNFWATWCPPCRAEMPSLNKLSRMLKARGLEVIAVSTDASLSDVKDFLKKNKVDFPVLHDSEHAASRLYRVFSMPTTFLIDKNGKIVEKFYGEYEWTEPETKGKIDKLL